MDEQERNIPQQIEANFDLNDFSKRYNLFYDWFCKDESLRTRGEVLSKKYLAVQKANSQAKYPWFKPEECYLFFKNNCPAWLNTTYDDFRICDRETGDVIFTITPSYPVVSEERHGISSWRYQTRSPKIVHRAEVWGQSNNFEEPLIDEGTWKDVLDFFRKGKPQRSPLELAKIMLGKS